MRPKGQSKPVAFLKLTRIEHSAMLVVAVLASEILSRGTLPGFAILLPSFIAPIFISMGSFAINDYFDVGVDRANGTRGRPLVSGALSMRSAMSISIASFAIGVAASAFINLYALLIAAIFAGMAMLYSYRLKELLAVGNAYIAAAMAIPFLFGAMAVSGSISPTIILLSATVLASGFAREVHGTIRDFEGDKMVRNVRSIPTYIGVRAASYLAALFYVIAIVLSVWLFFFAEPFLHNLFYLAGILAVDSLLVYVSASYIAVRKSNRRAVFARTRNLSLLAMGLALLIYLLSPFIFM